jgi:putative transposase
VRQAVKAGARLRFLRSCPTPDLKPIEQVFGKLKEYVRKAKPPRLRTLDGVSDAIAKGLAQISPDECANYLRGRRESAPSAPNSKRDADPSP